VWRSLRLRMFGTMSIVLSNKAPPAVCLLLARIDVGTGTSLLDISPCSSPPALGIVARRLWNRLTWSGRSGQEPSDLEECAGSLGSVASPLPFCYRRLGSRATSRQGKRCWGTVRSLRKMMLGSFIGALRGTSGGT
jgi:hypothetical protein